MRLFLILAVICSVSACNPVDYAISEEDEAANLTEGVQRRYHALLNGPYRTGLSHTGFIIGIEKSPRAAIEAPFTTGTSQPAASANPNFQPPHRAPSSGNQGDLDLQRNHFKVKTNDPSVMFVSHIIGYAPEARGARITPSLVYASYLQSGFVTQGRCDAAPDGTEQVYGKTWPALECLREEIHATIHAAAQRGAPFTHLMFMSMGWNNDQLEAVERYNSIVHYTLQAAKADGAGDAVFNPLVIGLTWPSVWGGQSVVDISNKALHIFSYPVKADDADEIGYTIANIVMNRLLPEMENRHNLKTIVVGHSMGARVMTTAYFGEDVLAAPVARKRTPPLVIGLQAAFSANRFVPGHRLPFPFSLILRGEGAPFQDVAEPGGDLVMTWSKEDKANPFARFLTGAKHVGGKPGQKIMRGLSKSVALTQADASGALDKEVCAQAKAARKLLYVDALAFVKDHGAIQNPGTGRLIWDAIQCYRR